MSESYGNGVRASSIDGVAWRKARASDAFNNCVEIARTPGGEVAVRNSRFPDGPALMFTRSEVAAFLEGARGGEFDSMTA
ncbi:regulator [Streptomyces sp. MUSC 125]|uniref:DUF397 domain-containing protein n=1 Tax=unclassified Streptomyces TaxID=2593676 RepID=UPI00057CF1D0|nr:MULTISPECIES: DUF397 domain-containing protein [unclassified Streptomyces]KIE24718.1 regulator [Streptomyces sp. MUSC 125]MCH0560402.1 DUF397 domain-containing protein [Streptomyces sp. MUM 16J]